MSVTAARPGSCASCGTELGPQLLACPRCQALVHAADLKRLAAEAEAAEVAQDLATAASTWQEALALLPPDARQHQVISARVTALGDRMVKAPGAKPAAATPSWARGGGALGAAALVLWKLKFILVFALTKAKLLLLGLTKMSTLFSMLVAFRLYWLLWGWQLAAGLVVSIYIHEMGHVAALARYGIKASAPMFIPGLGAVVRMKQYPPNAGLDARVGLAGPLWGLGAALSAGGVYLLTSAPVWLAVAKLGAWINLFNLLPVWQLDGGRGFRALNKRDRWIAAAVIATAWFLTAESLLVLLLLGAGYQAFRTAEAEERDLPVLVTYAGLVLALSWLAKVVVPGVGVVGAAAFLR